MKRLTCGALSALALLVGQAVWAGDIDFFLEVNNEAGDLCGSMQSSGELSLRGLLRSENAPNPDRGAQGWSLSLAFEGTDPTDKARGVVSATTAGTIADTNPPGIRLPLSFELTEVTTGFRVVNQVELPNVGCVSAVVFALVEDIAAPANGTLHILDFQVSAPVPPNMDECNDHRLVYLNGLVGGGQPVENNVTWEGLTVIPALGECSFQVCNLTPPEDCSNGIDDDEDGDTDCDDTDCSDDANCPENCTDGEDNDADGAVDCADSECAGIPPCPVPENNCLNGIDDDEDGLTDCDDPDCPAIQCECAEGPINVHFQGAASFDGKLSQSPNVHDGFAPSLEAGPGELTMYAAIASNLPGTGVQGWSLSIPVEDALPVSATTDGTIAAVGPPGIRLALSFELTEVTLTDDGHMHKNPHPLKNNNGFVSAVVFGLVQEVNADPVGTLTVLELVVDVPDPVSGRIFCQDGLQGGGQPVENLMTVAGKSVRFCGCFETRFVPVVGVSFSDFIRGDPNDDGKVNIADGVWVVNELFRGGPMTPCQDAADANDDGMVNLMDAVAIVDHRFRGTGPLPEPFNACGADPTDDTFDPATGEPAPDDDPTNDLPCPVGSVGACP